MSGNLIVRSYNACDADIWNDFVGRAANATFLHHRGFMDYHADRFEDCSYIIEQEGKSIAVLPANREGHVLVSHGGLTYGGLLVPPRLPAVMIVEIFALLRSKMLADGLSRMTYKPIPHIFHRQPSEADVYALINCGAQQIRADLGAAIPLKRRVEFSGGRKDGIRKARRAKLQVCESVDLRAFWGILEEVLGTRHDAVPTHSLLEIERLAGNFPVNIRLFATFDGKRMLAGILIFDCGQTVHAQYIASTEEGRHLGALDLLVHYLLNETFADREWFSFGISTTNAGKDLNVGLSRQKEMFGAHSVLFSQYQWDLT